MLLACSKNRSQASAIRLGSSQRSFEPADLTLKRLKRLTLSHWSSSLRSMKKSCQSMIWMTRRLQNWEQIEPSLSSTTPKRNLRERRTTRKRPSTITLNWRSHCLSYSPNKPSLRNYCRWRAHQFMKRIQEKFTKSPWRRPSLKRWKMTSWSKAIKFPPISSLC